ncbi:MAG: superoxide dismutase [Flavobacteriaceae bacterium]|jgi:Fe-Mn family superoxide dismutase|nr:superoxide dismutase [Flavobacteriaceae bacterium]
MINKHLINSAIIVLLFFSLQSCRKNQELIEVQIPERSTFETKKSKYSDPSAIKTKQGPFEMLGLPYKYDEISDIAAPEQVQLHYGVIHLTYANNLNSQIHNSGLEKDSITLVVKKLEGRPISLQDKAGGYYNHNIYWNTISKTTDTKPNDILNTAITTSFGSVSELKKQLLTAGKYHLGSGWLWLINNNGTLVIGTTNNNEVPTLAPNLKGEVIFAIDLWEHAYIQKFQDDKEAYLNACLNHLNWDYANKNFIIQP